MWCNRQQRQMLHLEREDDLFRQIDEWSLKGKLLEQTSNVLIHPDIWIFLKTKLDNERGEQTQEHKSGQSDT